MFVLGTLRGGGGWRAMNQGWLKLIVSNPQHLTTYCILPIDESLAGGVSTYEQWLNPSSLGYIGDEILHSYGDYFINHDKDPY